MKPLFGQCAVALVFTLVVAGGCVAEPAQKQKQSEDQKPAQSELPSAVDAGWELVFKDDFEREELGDAWEVVDGEWEIVDGWLRGGGLLLTSHGIPKDGGVAFQRMEFTAIADPQQLAFLQFGAKKSDSKEMSISDMTSMLHAQPPGKAPRGGVTQSGYLFQFGGYKNTVNRICKAGQSLWRDAEPKVLIQRDKAHRIIVENDKGTLRMYVDGQLLHEEKEESSAIGEGFDRMGLYFYTASKVSDVQMYVKRLPNGLDTD